MELIHKYFPELSEKQIFQFSSLENLYRDWNTKINLISRQDIENLYLKHVLHSLSLSKIISFVPGTRVLDVGTGGGFPGIPLAILFPSTQFILNDSIGKKIKVVNEIIQAIDLNNSFCLYSRAELIYEQFDFVVSRAVSSFPVFYSWVHDKILPTHKNLLKNGILYLKGGNISEEIKDFKKDIRLFHLKDFFNEEYFETKLVVYLPL